MKYYISISHWGMIEVTKEQYIEYGKTMPLLTWCSLVHWDI